IGLYFQQILFCNFLEAAAEVARFLLKQPLAHLRGFFAFLQIDPMADFAARVRGLRKAEPIAARAVALLSEDFDDIAADDLVAQRNHLPVTLLAHPMMAH